MSAPYPPQPGYPPAYPAQPGYPSQPGYLPPPPVAQIQCRLCGFVPAADVTFRGHRGMVMIMQFLHLRGPFCRDCGLATFREMTAKTLIQGWYGYASSIITPITVLINLARRGKVANLPPPQPPQYGPYGRPRDPGPPLLSRPSAVIGLFIPVAVIMLIVALVAIRATATPNY